ncbi:hypothetical protein RND71_013493 [Anisodus tanguticus]|uniref:Acid phosphatase n=1 Tax=Anisodus tanguticus TaxID=243964 RepID=A0AAE1SA80_9SOLA|nr:hypothetical protein RND71_013493 [Anisodus tanguticus]
MMKSNIEYRDITSKNTEVISQVVETHRFPQLNCRSWRLAVETNNIRDWTKVPTHCLKYVSYYMLGKQYRLECEAVANAAIEYAKSIKVGPHDVWIFDIDETALSNLPYFSRPDVDFGACPYNETLANEWDSAGKAPAIPAVLEVYKTVVSLGINPVFLSGSSQKYRAVRKANLIEAGYTSWILLILKEDNDTRSAVEFKTSWIKSLITSEYRIVGNIGDQWSDLIGENPGARTFKVPNPMYYIA